MDLSDFLLGAPVLLFSMVAHEYAHGYAALKQGDRTAYDLGRLTWNPLKHIDPFMTVLVPIMTWVGSGGRMMFGGAKPVPVDPRNYKNLRRGDIIVSLAGIAANLVLAVLLVTLVVPLGVAGRSFTGAADTFALLQRMMMMGVAINLLLAFFNLLPIPPLDGSHVLKYLLPRPLAIRYVQLGRFGFLILVAFLWFGGRWLRVWLTPALELQSAASQMIAPYILPQPTF